MRLKIIRAYGELLGVPHVAHGTRMVALERVGDCEICMFEALGAGSAEAPLFWMELFDLRVDASVDSCGCHSLSRAAAAFAEFASRAGSLVEGPLCPAAGMAG